MRPISVWQPRQVAGEWVFERPAPGPLGDHYASRRTIPRRKTAVRRICFFGESAAAGYLYAPALTPAAVLAAQLTALEGRGEYEVVDLARTNETLVPLVETARQALQLDPDLLVIYTGNNWNLLETPDLSVYAPSAPARREFGRLLAAEGLLGPARRARQELGAKVDAAFRQIAGLEVSVLLVIPEVNLADWESLQPVAWLPGDGVARWYAAFDRAQEHLRAGRWEAAEGAAWEMVAADGGSCPTPFRLLARALAGQGRLAAALDACQSEIDCNAYPLLGVLGAPQATSVARTLLANVAELHGFEVVDLRPVLAAAAGSPLPGRRYFLDYCHLTSEGIQVGMAAVAAHVLGRGDQVAVVAGVPEITPESEAVARLGAAIHNAHRLLPVVPERKAELLAHWCREALAASPGVAEAMLEVAAARAAPGPAVLAAALRQNLASPYPLLLQHGWRWDFLDVDLLQAMADALRQAGHPRADEIEAGLLAGWGLPAAGADLSRAPYLAEPLARFFPEAMTTPGVGGRAFYRAPWPRSTFCLITEGAQEIELRLTARLPANPEGGERSGNVEIEVEGIVVGTMALGTEWRRQTLRLAPDSLRRGLNRLTLRWPLPPPAADPLAAIVRRLERGLEADLHPVFGEVFALWARPGMAPAMAVVDISVR